MKHFNFGRNNGKPAAVTSWHLGDEGGKLRLGRGGGGGNLSLGRAVPPSPTALPHPPPQKKLLLLLGTWGIRGAS